MGLRQFIAFETSAKVRSFFISQQVLTTFFQKNLIFIRFSAFLGWQSAILRGFLAVYYVFRAACWVVIGGEATLLSLMSDK